MERSTQSPQSPQSVQAVQPVPVTVVNKFKEEFTDYIGKGSAFGNPFATKAMTDEVRDHACDSFEQFFTDAMSGTGMTAAQIRLQQGVTSIIKRVRNGEKVVLGCFCKPKRCHGETIANYINAEVKRIAEIRQAAKPPMPFTSFISNA